MRALTKFARHYNRSPDRISNDELKAYLLYLHQEEQRATSTCNVASAALRFRYHRTLGQSHTRFDVPMARQPSKLPFVLSPDEVARLIACTSLLKHRALFLTTYSAGLRISEVVRLRPADIDSSRMLMRVEQGKGSKDRLTLLSPQILNFNNGRVSFRVRDSANAKRKKVMQLDEYEFIRHFLLHVLPKGFVRIRHDGLLAVPKPEEPPTQTRCEKLLELTGFDIGRCPTCHEGRMGIVVQIDPARAAHDAYGPGDPSSVEAVAVFWHLVDLIWIFLCPLIYLAR